MFVITSKYAVDQIYSIHRTYRRLHRRSWFARRGKIRRDQAELPGVLQEAHHKTILIASWN